jgi:hypothetical protein
MPHGVTVTDANEAENTFFSRHRHTNRPILERFSLDEADNLLFDGNPIVAGETGSDIRQLLGTLYNNKYAYLTQDSDILIDGMISTPASIKIKVKSYSETETGNAYCRVIDDEGGATAWSAIPVTLDWTTVTLDVSSLNANTVLKFERDSDQPEDTLGDPEIAMLIANEVAV